MPKPLGTPGPQYNIRQLELIENALGLLIPDNDIYSFKWQTHDEDDEDSRNLVMELTNAGLLSMTPSGTGSQDILSILPQAPLDAAAHWAGLKVDTSLLSAESPAGAGSHIDGVEIDHSNVDISEDIILHGVNILMPAVYTGELDKCGVEVEGGGMKIDICELGPHALLIDGPGDINMNYDGSAITADDIFSAVKVQVNQGAAAAGMIHCFEASAIAPDGVTTEALGVFPGVGVIHQHVGTPAALDKAWQDDGGFVDETAAFGNPAVNHTLFNTNGTEVYVGSLSVFDLIEVLLTTPSSKDIIATFEFSQGGGVWQAFSPADNTLGFQQDGNIFFDSVSLLADGWAVQAVNGEGDGPFFYIRITRTRIAVIVTPPIEETIQISATTEYHWNKLGDIRCRYLVVTDIAGAPTPDKHFIVQDADGNSFKVPLEAV